MPCHWGILGPGFIATRAVIPALRQVRDARVLAVASRDRERARETAVQFQIERVYDSYQALLDDPEVQAVYIALPNHLHCEWTLRAAQAGKHVLCEKPLALSTVECDRMIAACQQANVLLMEAVMYRFHPRMIALKQMLSSGATGIPRFIHTAFSFPFNSPDNYRAYPQFGGGALLDVGSYCINAVRWLTGLEPNSAQSIASYSQGIDVSISAMFRFDQNDIQKDVQQEGGQKEIVAHIQCSFASAEYQVIEVVGSEGAVTAPLAFTAWRNDTTALHIQRGSQFERLEFAPADPYQLMASHFTDCVLEGKPVLYPPEDGRATIRAVEMVRLSLAR